MRVLLLLCIMASTSAAEVTRESVLEMNRAWARRENESAIVLFMDPAGKLRLVKRYQTSTGGEAQSLEAILDDLAIGGREYPVRATVLAEKMYANDEEGRRQMFAEIQARLERVGVVDVELYQAFGYGNVRVVGEEAEGR